MDLAQIEFDDKRARKYRKEQNVMAFRSNDAFTFSKNWGEQHCRPNSWIIIPISKEGKPTQDIYGCDGAIFKETYGPVSDSQPFTYRKLATILAYQPGTPFAVRTVLKDGTIETTVAKCESTDGWIVKNPGGEVYPVENEKFRRSYVLVED